MADPQGYEWFRAEGEHDAGLPQGRDPREYPWGMYATDGSPLVSVGMFFWFSTAEELTSWFREVEPQIYGLEGAEVNDFRAVVEPALSAFIAGVDPEQTAEQINAAQSEVSVVWWGRFDALCSKDSEWERDFRSEFRERNDDEPDPSPIAAKETDDFIAFISEYGY